MMVSVARLCGRSLFAAACPAALPGRPICSQAPPHSRLPRPSPEGDLVCLVETADIRHAMSQASVLNITVFGRAGRGACAIFQAGLCVWAPAGSWRVSDSWPTGSIRAVNGVPFPALDEGMAAGIRSELEKVSLHPLCVEHLPLSLCTLDEPPSP